MPPSRSARINTALFVYLALGFALGAAFIARGFELAHGDWHACAADAAITRCIASWRTLPSLWVLLGAAIIVFCLVGGALRLPTRRL